jgi:hypothetical protein
MAQKSEYRGAVMDYEDGKRIAGAEIINLNSKEKILSNTMGVFSIKGKEGDTLRITRSDYSEMETILHGTADVIIRLKTSFQLKEVNVYGQSKKDQLDDVMNDFRKKGNYYNGKPPALAYVLSPISALYGLLGKTPKNARRFQSYMNFELEQSMVDRKFNINLVQASTGLSGEDLLNFMDIYRPSFYQAEKWNEYDARTYIKKSFDNFEASGRPSTPKLPKIEIPKQEK